MVDRAPSSGDVYGGPMIVKWWRRLRDAWTTARTNSEIADRECRHDGSYPRCGNCDRYATGW